MARRTQAIAGCICLAVSLAAGLARAGGPSWDARAAAEYLDGRADWWLGWTSSARGQGTACLSCHTAVPFALARPALDRKLGASAAGDAERRLVAGVTRRVERWAEIMGKTADGDKPLVPFYGGSRKPSSLGTEAVLNALVLANFDARRKANELGDTTRTAFAHMWEQQQPGGGWLWLEFGLRPWEKDAAYFGAALAAHAVGTAGPAYYGSPGVRPKVAALTNYLVTNLAAESLHHRAVTAWASGKLPGVLSADAKAQLAHDLFAVQGDDGSWSLVRLGKVNADWPSHGVHPAGAAGDG